MTAQEIIEISSNIPLSEFNTAREIVTVFQETKKVFIHKNFGFLEMVTAIWYGGYMAGVQAERRKRRNR